MERPSPSPQEAFEQHLRRIETHARIQFRDVRCPAMKADCIAEAVAISWKWWLRLLEQGKEPETFVSSIATFAVKQVRIGRRITGQEKAKDVMSPRAQRSKGFVVGKLPDYATLKGTPAEDALQDNTVTPPDEAAAFRIDFPAWLASFDEHRRRIIDMLVQGDRTMDIADAVGKSAARISQMKQEFALAWAMFLEE